MIGQWVRAIEKISLRDTLSALFLGFLVFSTACAPQLKGTDLGKEPAPEFRLNDSDGNPVSLADFRGKVVVLTFLYTQCPDGSCPLLAAKLRTAASQLGETMKQAAYIAVSIDPDNDTPAAIREFLHEQGLDGQLRYLSGSRAQLEPVWNGYFIGTAANTSSLNTVASSLRVIVIDKAGKQRVELESNLVPADLVQDVRALLAE